MRFYVEALVTATGVTQRTPYTTTHSRVAAEQAAAQLNLALGGHSVVAVVREEECPQGCDDAAHFYATREGKGNETVDEAVRPPRDTERG